MGEFFIFTKINSHIMRKMYFVLAAFLLVSSVGRAQMRKKDTAELETAKYAGKYTYGEGTDFGNGEVLVYPESDSTILFYINIEVGEPSYNMGDLYGRVSIVDGKGVFERKTQYSDDGCKWSMTFTDDKLIIEILDEQYECGFGYGVYADGEYARKNNIIPEYFIDFADKKHYFKKLRVEE